MENLTLNRAHLNNEAEVKTFVKLQNSIANKITYPIGYVNFGEEVTARFRNNQIYFIKLGTEIVGSIEYRVISKYYSQIDSIVVVRDKQGQGIGPEALKLLMDKKLDHVKSIGSKIHSYNTHALEIFKRAGFKVQHTDSKDTIEGFYYYLHFER